MIEGKRGFVPNTIGHFDIAGDDLKGLGAFYAKVFGWEIQSMGPGYSLIKTPKGSVGGALVESESPSLTVGIVVPDLDRALRSSADAGGRIVMEKTDNGWVKKGQVTDPAGNRLTLIQG
jgi:predicted enzyme related to lactoylglutathione lyase